ncbi:MAG: response regulator [Lachnospiraceae bacterium]|nr:response regulator [Lachnospiraceae bacterium]
MYKVVIIDDEPIIVEGLSRVVDWEKYGCHLAGTAEDGVSGMRVIREVRPDMIITDICMPKTDGLSMIAALKSEFPEMQICILTGYRDFDYAQRAITLGVTRFLLKPSNMGQLDEAILEMTHRLKKRNNMHERITHKSEDIRDEEAKEEGASSFIVKNALIYMEEHYEEHLSLSEVADQIYVSQWHLSKLLNKYEKKSFSEILNQIRVDHAKELLKNPALRIRDVAEQVGFLDITHFSRVFKKHEGISANEYRNARLS